MTSTRLEAGSTSAGQASEIIDALTEAHDHMQFVQGVLGQIRLNSSAHSELSRRIRAIEERLSDPRHYLAVIGEFNSGKSTLINAMLGDTLLTSNPWPTTQTTTRLQHAARIVVRCEFRDDDRRYEFPAGPDGTTWQAFARKIRAVSGASVSNPSDVPGLLALLTADEQVAHAVRAVTIDHPAPVLAEGLVIIDTPGTNAEAGHTEITRRVLSDDADAAVVLLAADNPLGESLASFLIDALDERLLGRCVFVVTKMVHVDGGEEQALLDSIHRRIHNKLGIADPIVLPVSVGCVVRQLQGKAPTVAERRWIARFANTSQELSAILEQRRAIGVSDRILRLLDELLYELRKDLKSRSTALRREESALKSSNLVDLDSFLEHRRSLTASSILQQRRFTQDVVDRAVQGFEEKLVDRALTVVSKPSSTRQQDLESVVQEQLKDIESRCQPGFTAANRALAKIMKGNERAFAAEYAKLAPLATGAAPGMQSPTIDSESMTQGSLSDVWALTAKQDTAEMVLFGGGAAAGALIGTIFIPIPVLGTALGALIGATSVLFGSERRERELRNKVTSSMRSLATRVRGDLADRISTMGDDHAAVAIRHIDDAAAHYRPRVRRMVADHRKRQQGLSQRRRDLDAEIVEIERRSRRVAAHRERLATLQRRRG